MSSPAFRFDGKNERAQKVAKKRAAALVTRVSSETRQALRAIVVRSIRDGIPVYDAARLMRSLIGTTTAQAAAAASYRAELIDSGLALDKVNARLDRYVEKQIRQRAETIARTETMAALNDGALEGYRQAREEGLLGSDAMKEWIITPDELLCPDCAPMEGVKVPLADLFDTPAGSVPGPPLHPRCRCAVVAVP